MKKDARINSIDGLYELYPLCRKLIYDTFDKNNSSFTRTQQLILLTLYHTDKFSMSKLAARINTSNEQCTRAVAPLVEKNYLLREKDTLNRRVINISLTEKAIDLMTKIRSQIISNLLGTFSEIPDEDMVKFNDTLSKIIKTLNVSD